MRFSPVVPLMNAEAQSSGDLGAVLLRADLCMQLGGMMRQALLVLMPVLTSQLR